MLDVALESLTEAPLSWVPVLDDERRVVGTLSISDVVRAYRQELAAGAERVSELGAMTGASRVTISSDPTIAGKSLRQAGLPKGLLITSISRGDAIFVPGGDTIFAVGDHIFALGKPSDLELLGQVDTLPAPAEQPEAHSP
jgi:uncharacterized protein with PhoU and TrkA domain